MKFILYKENICIPSWLYQNLKDFDFLLYTKAITFYMQIHHLINSLQNSFTTISKQYAVQNAREEFRGDFELLFRKIWLYKIAREEERGIADKVAPRARRGLLVRVANEIGNRGEFISGLREFRALLRRDSVLLKRFSHRCIAEDEME